MPTMATVRAQASARSVAGPARRRIVLTSFGSFGDVNPYLGLGRVLRARGHEVRLAVPAAYRGMVEREDLEHFAVRPDLDIHDRAFAARIMDPVHGTDVTFGEVLLPNLEHTVEDLTEAVRGADLLVTHPASLAGPIVAEEQGLPWASSVLAPMSFFSRFDPIVPAPAPWMHELTSRSMTVSRLFLWQTERVTRKWADPVRDFRRSRGLPAGENAILEGQHSPHLVLGLFSRVLGEPQADWPEHVEVTGAVIYNGAGPAELPTALEAFLRDGDPPLVFTLGTSAVGSAGGFYDVSASVAARLGRRAVLLAGRHPENRPEGVDPSRVFVADFARHDALFPRACAIVHQGGAGTLHQALQAGRPMLIVPHAHDQPDNAHRAERIGVARVLRPSRYRVDQVEAEIRALLERPSYGVRAQEVAEIVASEPGAEGAAGAIERLLA